MPPEAFHFVQKGLRFGASNTPNERVNERTNKQTNNYKVFEEFLFDLILSAVPLRAAPLCSLQLLLLLSSLWILFVNIANASHVVFVSRITETQTKSEAAEQHHHHS